MTCEQPALTFLRCGRNRLARLAMIPARRLPGVCLRERSQRCEWLAQQLQRGRRQVLMVACEEIANLLQRGLGEYAAVFPGGAQAGKAHRQPSGAIAPKHASGIEQFRWL